MFRFVLFIVVIIFPSHLMAVCTEQDEKTAAFWGNAYTTEEAYKFGNKIQTLVREKDMKGLLKLVDGNPGPGLRRKYALSKTFDEIFPADWQESVLSYETPCSQNYGWRGFAIGGGRIWYEKGWPSWSITSIHGANVEQFESGGKLLIDGQVVHPQCFFIRNNFVDQMTTPDYEHLNMSRDEYFDDFGKVFGTKVIKFEEFGGSLNQCSADRFDFKMKDGFVYFMTPDEEADSGITTPFIQYSVLKELDPDLCEELAPNFELQCLRAFIVDARWWFGGTIGWDEYTSVYALYDINELGKTILPLKNLGGRSGALDYIDYLENSIARSFFRKFKGIFGSE